MSKNIVVIGGSKGIGLAIVRQLTAEGHQVFVFSRSSEGLDQINQVAYFEHDVTSDTFPAEQLPSEIHGLVYCPGSLNLKSAKSLKPETFREDFEVNVVGAIKAIQASLKGLKASGSSSIVLFSTVAVAQGMFAHASIAASKGAIEGLSKTLAAELAPTTRVNCVAPALTNTDLTSRFFSSDEKIAAMGEKYPLGRTGTPEDLAAISCFLLGDQSTWITGQTIGVDGGMSTVRK